MTAATTPVIGMPATFIFGPTSIGVGVVRGVNKTHVTIQAFRVVDHFLDRDWRIVNEQHICPIAEVLGGVHVDVEPSLMETLQSEFVLSAQSLQ